MIIKRTDRSIFADWWWTIDRWILAALFALISIGILLIVAASPPTADRLGLESYHFVKRHLFFLMPTIFGLFVASLLSPRGLRRLGLGIFITALLLTVLTLFYGNEIKGAQRWLHFGFFSLQPSEFMKPAFIVLTAWLLSLKTPFGIRLCVVLYVLVIGLLLLQPDVGMSILMSMVWFGQLFLAGLPTLIVVLLLIVGTSGLAGSYVLFPHVKSRVDRFLNPAHGDQYQIERALDSFVQGGWTGTGPGQGEIKFILPDAHADFIFAVAGEEFGLLATFLILGIFGFILVRGFKHAHQNSNLFCFLAMSGLLIQFGLQALIHMASSLHLIPTKGMTLPFISYGGSSMVALGLTMGMVLSLTRRQLYDP